MCEFGLGSTLPDVVERAFVASAPNPNTGWIKLCLVVVTRSWPVIATTSGPDSDETHPSLRTSQRSLEPVWNLPFNLAVLSLGLPTPDEILEIQFRHQPELWCYASVVIAADPNLSQVYP